MELFKKLYAEFILSYEEVHANILDDIKFYITTLRGAVIYSDGYLQGMENYQIELIYGWKKTRTFYRTSLSYKKRR